MSGEKKRIVVKVGSSTITYQNGKANIRKIERLARVMSDLHNSGHEMVLVSSGAIAVGVGRLELNVKPESTRMKQAAAAVGQCDLMFMYDKLFGEYNTPVAQILLTRDIVEDENRKENTENTFAALIEMGVIPIVNENDTVSTEEIFFGDNDHLSAIVAELCSADLLIMVTDTDGLYDKDPRIDSSAKLISHVEHITPEMRECAGGSGTLRGTGGMHTKVLAAEYAVERGIKAMIISGEEPELIYKAVNGDAVGTTFEPVSVE